MIGRSLGIGAIVVLTACGGSDGDPKLMNISQPRKTA